MWGRLILEGFSDGRDVTDEQAAAVTDACYNYHRLLACAGGERAGGGATNYYEGAAAFCGDATLPRFRGCGVQSALIARRLREARQAGCDLAIACVIPGSGSHRNYERLGFRLVYMRVNVMREPDHGPIH
jgi:GNAT superfamily N-acetyltransferase